MPLCYDPDEYMNNGSRGDDMVRGGDGGDIEYSKEGKLKEKAALKGYHSKARTVGVVLQPRRRLADPLDKIKGPWGD